MNVTEQGHSEGLSFWLTRDSRALNEWTASKPNRVTSTLSWTPSREEQRGRYVRLVEARSVPAALASQAAGVGCGELLASMEGFLQPGPLTIQKRVVAN